MKYGESCENHELLRNCNGAVKPKARSPSRFPGLCFRKKALSVIKAFLSVVAAVSSKQF